MDDMEIAITIIWINTTQILKFLMLMEVSSNNNYRFNNKLTGSNKINNISPHFILLFN